MTTGLVRETHRAERGDAPGKGAMRAFWQLGAAIEQAWSRANLSERALPEIAERALTELRDEPDLSDVAQWVLREHPGRLLPQRDLDAVFGDPPITLYTGRRLDINLHLWLTSTTSVHQHGFCGAFRVLEGSSIHGVYGFEESRAVNSHFRLGDIKLTALEHLKSGDVRRIVPGPEMVHSLFHLEYPSASIVVRSRGEAALTPQLSYLTPSIAMDSSYFPGHGDPALTRQVQVLRFLSETDSPQFRQELEQFIEKADIWTGFLSLYSLLDVFAANGGRVGNIMEELQRYIDVIAKYDAELGHELPAVFGDLIRRRLLAGQRRYVRDPGARFFLALLMTAPDRHSMLEVIRAAWGDAYAKNEQLAAWIDWLADQAGDDNSGLSGLGIGRDTSVVLRRLVETEGDWDSAQRLLKDDFPEFVVEKLSARLQAMRDEIRNYSVFRPLFR